MRGGSSRKSQEGSLDRQSAPPWQHAHSTSRAEAGIPAGSPPPGRPRRVAAADPTVARRGARRAAVSRPAGCISGGAPSFQPRSGPGHRRGCTSPPHGWDSVATAADARSLQPRAPGGGDGERRRRESDAAATRTRRRRRRQHGRRRGRHEPCRERRSSLVARLGALGLSREQALAALRDVERIGRLSGGGGGGGGGGHSGGGLSGGGGGGGGARPRPPADTPAFLGWEPYGLAFEKGVEASYARFRQGIVVGFGEGEKVGLVEAYAQFRAGFKEGYFATFKAAYLKGQADFEADARAAVARAYALAKAPGGASTAATSLLHAAGPPPRRCRRRRRRRRRRRARRRRWRRVRAAAGARARGRAERLRRGAAARAARGAAGDAGVRAQVLRQGAAHRARNVGRSPPPQRDAARRADRPVIRRVADRAR